MYGLVPEKVRDPRPKNRYPQALQEPKIKKKTVCCSVNNKTAEDESRKYTVLYIKSRKSTGFVFIRRKTGNIFPEKIRHYEQAD